MRCCGDVSLELMAVDLGILFTTPADLLRYEQNNDPYGGRAQAWLGAGSTKVWFGEQRPGEPHREGEKKVPQTAPFVICSPLTMPARVRDRWRVTTQFGIADYEVEEVMLPGTFDFFFTSYCAAVDEYEPAS